jgi:hypothetical protein
VAGNVVKPYCTLDAVSFEVLQCLFLKWPPYSLSRDPNLFWLNNFNGSTNDCKAAVLLNALHISTNWVKR